MSKRKIDSSELKALVGELREGDGIDPRAEERAKRKAARTAHSGDRFHHQERLARQVREAIDLALQTARSRLLNALVVQDVVQEQTGLTIVLTPRVPTDPLDFAAAVKALARATPMLRSEVATAITRKELPTIRFVLLPGGSQPAGESISDAD